MQLHSSQGQADTNPEKLQVLDADARIFLFEGFLTPGGPACQYVRGQQPSSSDAALYPGLGTLSADVFISSAQGFTLIACSRLSQWNFHGAAVSFPVVA